LTTRKNWENVKAIMGIMHVEGEVFSFKTSNIYNKHKGKRDPHYTDYEYIIYSDSDSFILPEN
jgi:hypothetical protein